MNEGPAGNPQIVVDDLTDHLLPLHAEFSQAVDDMTAINATSAASAHYAAQRTCHRFLTTPQAPELHDGPTASTPSPHAS